MEENLPKKLEIRSGAKFRKMSQIGQGGPPRHPKKIKKISPKGPGPNFGPRVPWPIPVAFPIPLGGQWLYCQVFQGHCQVFLGLAKSFWAL